MNNFPKISIITPTYNQGRYIQMTIDSVLNQNYPNLEYIIMDGGSTDDTVSILKSYNKNIIWFSEKDRGQTHAINKGLQIATGDIIAYINSDDVYKPNAFFKVARFFQDHPAAMWVTGLCDIVDENFREVRKPITWYKNFWLLFHSYQVLLILDYVSQPSTFWRRALIDQVGCFDESLYLVMDYDYWLKIGKKYPLYVIPQYLSSFRTHPSSKTRSLDTNINNEEMGVIKRYTKSSFATQLHTLHWKLMLSIYRKI